MPPLFGLASPQEAVPYFRYPSSPSSPSQLTFASIGAAAFSRTPGQLIVEALTLFTVQPFGVVFADTAAVHLLTNKRDVGLS